jgi:hypothetical protein
MRTYDLETGGLRRLHKLYSSAEPVISDLSRLDADRPAGWEGEPD